MCTNVLSYNSNKREILLKALEKYGKELQMYVLIEELNELSKELIKHIFRNSKNSIKVFEEMADVKIMLEQYFLIEKGNSIAPYSYVVTNDVEWMIPYKHHISKLDSKEKIVMSILKSCNRVSRWILDGNYYSETALSECVILYATIDKYSELYDNSMELLSFDKIKIRRLVDRLNDKSYSNGQ